VTTHGELRHRLALDRRAIAASLRGGGRVGRVLEVRSGLSDPHDGGRSVALVRFASGLRIVYKPRPVGLEAAFHRLVAWWNQRVGRLALSAPRVLDRGDYGWVEFVAHEGCADRAAAGRYWERAGALIALAGLLDATDLHCGNVIAHGEHPVLVDLETLLHPRWPGEERSLLDTGLVPSWIRGPDGDGYDVSGFGAIAPQRFAGAPVPLRQNVVRIGGKIVSPAAFAGRLVTGFRRAAAVVCSSRKELLAAAGPLRAFRRLEVRVMLRHTETYRVARDSGSTPGPESLLRPVREPYVLAAIAEIERARLLHGDIPRFIASTGSPDWTPHPTLTVPGCFTASSYAALIARTEQIESAVFEEQARLLSTALALWALGGAMAAADSGGGRRSGVERAAPPVQQHHEDEVEERGAPEEKQDEPAHARGTLL
jgi:class II lanthipeptide synthase